MRFIFAVGLALATALWAQVTLAETGGRMTVTGEGRVSAPPDMATITLGVTVRSKTASAALAEVNGRVRDIFAVLSQADVAEGDIQTSDLSLSPLYPNRSNGSNLVEIEGYAASNRVTIRHRDLASLGLVLDAVAGAGANQFWGLQFGLQNPEPVRDAARKAAVAEARRKADLYSAAADITLGPLVSFSEGAVRAPQPVFREMAMAADAGVPVAGGEVDLTAQVTLVYQIKD